MAWMSIEKLMGLVRATMSGIVRMNMMSEQKHFFKCTRKEAFFEKKRKLSNLKLVNIM